MRAELTSCRERDKALSTLKQLHVIGILTDKRREETYVLSKHFGQALRQALTGGGNHKSFGIPCNPPAKDGVTIEQLDDFARKQWEGLLSYMVGSAAGSSTEGKVSDSVRNLLVDGELVSNRGRRPTITKDGFTFVLEEVNAQVWTILVFYLDAAESVYELSHFILPD